MANLLADAQNNLANWGNTYQQVRQNHERLDVPVTEFAKEGEDDENGRVNPAAVLVGQDHARMAASLDASLLATLATFDAHVKIAPTNERNTFLDALFDQNSAAKDNKQVKSRGTVYGAVTVGTNTGNSVLVMCSKDRNNDVIESATIELLNFRCIGAASNRQSLGRESWIVQGAGKSTRTEFSEGGTGTRLAGLTAVGPGRSSLIANASFDLAFNGSGVSKIQGFDIISGDTGIARETTIIAEDRGQSHSSLVITSNCKFRFYFRKRNIGLSYNTPYVMGFRYRTAGAYGTITQRMSGTNYTKAVNTANTSGVFVTAVSDPDTQYAWRNNFDTDGNPYLEIEVSGFTTGPIYIDDLICEPMDFIAGRWVSLVSGVTASVVNDSHTQECTLTVGSGSVALTGGASGSIDTITADGVSLLSAAIPFNTSLAQTAQDAVDNINAGKRFPNYVASRSSNTIIIKQIVPVEGTIVLASTVTTITKTDTNITGAALGKTQDAIVRRTGKYLPHASSASSGWGDHA